MNKGKRKKAGGPKSREELSKNSEPGTLLGSGLSSVSINVAALLLQTGRGRSLSTDGSPRKGRKRPNRCR